MNIYNTFHSKYKNASSRHLFKKIIKVHLNVSIISFCFDDFPKNALENGGGILSDFGYRGTFYVSMGLMGKVIETGKMFGKSEILNLHENGHELGCHTFDHCHSWETNPKKFKNSIIRNQLEVRKIVPSIKFETFSYPISSPNPISKYFAGKKFKCCRNGDQKANIEKADLRHLNSYFIEKANNDIDLIKRLIDYNKNMKGWLILSTHDVCNHPSKYGCTSIFFNKIVEYANRSNSIILPVKDAIDHICK